jgi:hypothetical protein
MLMMTPKHWLAHRLGWNEGTIETWWERPDRLMVGFRCDGCRQLSGVHVSPFSEAGYLWSTYPTNLHERLR